MFFIKKRLAQVFSCEFCEISKNNFFTEHLWATTSEMLGQLSQKLIHHLKPSELQSTQVLVGYFRRSIPNFSKVVTLLNSLLKLHPEKLEKKLLRNSEHQQALDQLLSYLTTTPMVAYPDFNNHSSRGYLRAKTMAPRLIKLIHRKTKSGCNA